MKPFQPLSVIARPVIFHWHRSRLRICLGLGCIALMTSSFMGCTPHKESSALIAGSAALRFDPKSVTELEIQKSDPSTGDRWSARLAQNSSRVLEIHSAPEHEPLLDRRANQNLILHLLDTISTLKVVENAPTGPLPSFGLEPPRFALRWKAAQAHELLVGDPVGKEKAGFYARIDGSQPIILQGVASRLLAELSSFEAVRDLQLIPVHADDVDEIRVETDGTTFYAQRDGERWTDQSHRPFARSGEVSAWLHSIVSSRYLRVTGEGIDRANAGAQRLAKAQIKLLLRGREQDLATTLLAPLPAGAGRTDRSAQATVSARGGAIFEVSPDLLKRLSSCPLPRYSRAGSL